MHHLLQLVSLCYVNYMDNPPHMPQTSISALYHEALLYVAIGNAGAKRQIIIMSKLSSVVQFGILFVLYSVTLCVQK